MLSAWQSVAQSAERHYWLVLIGFGDGGELAQRVAAAQRRGNLKVTCVRT